MIKIGIDNFNHQKPVDNCVDFELGNHEGWNRHPCHTGFAIGEFLDSIHIHALDTQPLIRLSSLRIF